MIALRTLGCKNESILSRCSLSESSKKEYNRYLKLFAYEYPELPTTPQPIQAWLAKCAEHKTKKGEKGVSETVCNHFAILRAFYNLVCEWHPDILPETNNHMLQNS